MGTLATLLARLDPDPGVRGKQFEQICRWYLRTDPLYRRELKRVWLWDEWPGRWGADAGIDLVAEARDGGLWAIQAKAYDPRYRIKKSDVDTFLSESARPGFSFRLLIATTNEIGATARRTLEAQEKPGHLLFLADLERAALDWPTTPRKLEGKHAKPKRPRPHQQRAIADVKRGFEDSGRGQLIMACGTGKTLTALWIHEELAAERTLVLLPSLSLLAQTLREWTANATQEFEFLPVCSDETVTGTDSLVSKTADLGFPVTTESAEIASFLRKRGPRVIFSTYQSSPQIAEALLGRVPGFDLAIADEAHRCAGRISGDFATILDDRAIRARRRLFMTATPRYFTGRVIKEAAEADLEVASMDDPTRFGPVFHRLTFGEAIERDLLSDYQVAVVVVNDATFREYAERGVFVTTDGEKVTDARTLAAQIGLAKAMRRYDLRRVVSFHSRVAWARDFSHSLPEVIAWMPARERPKGGLWSSYVSGEMPSGHRDVLLGRLRDMDDERGLLCNARCLAEGVDVPTLDGVAFIDPRRSEVDIVQAVGRAIRKSPDKKMGTIVLPVFIEGGDRLGRTLESSMFKHVWDVLKALRAHDEQLAEELDELRREMGYRRTSAGRPGKIELLLPIGVDVDFAQAFDVQLVERATSSWEFAFGILARFVEREGHARVTFSHREDDYLLGHWVNAQRQVYGRGDLNDERITRLEALPGWVWTDDRWEQGFEALQRFVEREGHASVPAKHVEGSLRLGGWVNGQRTRYGNGTLRADRSGRLEALTGWSWDERDAAWKRAYAALLKFQQREGHVRVPKGQIESGVDLGVWVITQRQRRRRIGVDRQRLLEAVPGWTWTPQVARWEEGFARLAKYVEREESAVVPYDWVENGLPLGHWVSTQRLFAANGQLNDSRVARLEALPGWTWDLRDASWEAGFAALVSFTAREGSARVPRSHMEDGFPLGVWVGTQRSRRSRRTADQARRLESLPGWTWDSIEAAWGEGFRCLETFVAREGHCRVPRDHREDGFPLAQWILRQRQAWRRKRLSTARALRLETVPGWSWDPKSQAWEEAFAAVAAHVALKGRLPTRGDHVEGDLLLGVWVSHQRNRFRRGQLTGHEISRLESLSGWTWDPKEAGWEDGFRKLLSFVEREGHARVPQSHVEAGFRLGQWVGDTRLAQERLSADRLRRLVVLPGWSWDTRRDRWEEGFSKLATFAGHEGHSNVPPGHMEDGFPLGRWVRKQRSRREALESSRRMRLESLPDWTWRLTESEWETGFVHLLRYVKEHAGARVPQQFVAEDGYKLGTWVSNQRTRRKGLNVEHVRRLEELPGWSWQPKEENWDIAYLRLLRFVERERHARPPDKYVEDGFPLGSWVSVQRQFHKKGFLRADRARRLEDIPGWTWKPPMGPRPKDQPAE